MLRRFLATLLAAAVPLASTPAVWAGDGVISTTVQTGGTAGPVAVTPGANVNGGTSDSKASSGGALKSRSLQNFNRRGSKDFSSPSPALRAPSPATGRGNASLLPAESGEGPAAAVAAGDEGQSAVESSGLTGLTKELQSESSHSSSPLSSKKHLDRAFSNTRVEAGPDVAVTAAPSRSFASRTPLPLRPQGSGWFGGVSRAGNGATPAAAAKGPVSYDYARMFDISRRMLTRQAVKQFIRDTFKEELTIPDDEAKKYGVPDKIKEVSQSQFMLLLQHNPTALPFLEQYLEAIEKLDDKKDSAKTEEIHKQWRDKFKAFVADKDLADKFKKLNDPLEPLHMETEDGGPGYKVEAKYVTHLSIQDGKQVPGQDLRQAVVDFIGGAKKEIMVNVFDFDLMVIADALIARGAAGVKVTVGIDKRNVDGRPEVKAVFDKLSKAKNVTVVAVDSVGLNHQKIVVRDWSSPKDARTLFSSGNFTQSCIGPEGDLVDGHGVPGVGAPNANHLVVLSGQLVALTAADNLTKTLIMKLRGDEYPLGGAFQFDGGKDTTLTLAFSPKGGLGDINRDVIKRMILQTRGPLRVAVFAFSSTEVRDAIVERAKLEKKEGHDFDFKAVGDNSFTMRDYSILLNLSGLELKETKDKKEYVALKDNPLRDAMGKEKYEAMLKDIRVAPEIYRDHHVKDKEGKDQVVNAKLHHKIFRSGNAVNVGTSFNPSDNANHNNEQILVFNDPDMAKWMDGIIEGLLSQTNVSVTAAAESRNEIYKKGGKVDDDDDSETGPTASQQKRKPARAGNGMSPEFKAEAKRKLFHQALLTYLAAYHFLGEKTSLMAMAVWAGVLGIGETARIVSKKAEALSQRWFGGLLREKEQGHYTGTFFAALGILSVFALYGSHPTIVAASILYLALGDAASALVGRAIGKHKFQVLGQDRSVEGTLAGLLVSLGIGAALGLSPALIAAGAGAFLVADLLPLPPNDNFWIPVLTSTALWAAGGPMIELPAVTMTHLLSILGLGFFLGMRHATDSDHVAAVATIVSRSKRMGTAWLLGAFWGVGHTATIAAVGAAIILFRLVIPPHIGLGMEFVVGGVLVALGLANVFGFWTGAGRVTAHEHVHGHDQEHGHDATIGEHEHPHFHTEETGWFQRNIKEAGWAQIGRSTVVGLMHGLAGSAAVALLVLATIPDPLGAMVYLVVFGAGTLGGMLFLSALMEFSMFKLTKWWKPGERTFIVLTGLISLAYGAYLMYHIGYVDGLFSANPHWTPN